MKTIYVYVIFKALLLNSRLRTISLRPLAVARVSVVSQKQGEASPLVIHVRYLWNPSNCCCLRATT